jgi:hypothetical protein
VLSHEAINVPDKTVELGGSVCVIAVDQGEAILMDDNEKFTRLFWQMDAVEGSFGE